MNKKRNIFKKIVSFVMAIALVLTGVQLSPKVAQAASSSTNKLPITCYTLNGRVTTYTTEKCTTNSGYIDSVDLCKIKKFYPANNSVQVEYPISRGKKTAYAKIESFFANANFSTAVGKTGKRLTAYRKSSGSSTIGTVYASDVCIVTGTANGRTQLIFPVSGGYKCGWVNGTYNFNKTTPTITALTSTQGTYICFNAVYYANKYPDLKAAFGYDYNKLLSHWLNYGIREGRSASPVFDPVYYLKNNADLTKAFGSTNYVAAYNHFLQYGCSEGRKSSQFYQGSYYRQKYGDLSHMDYYNLAAHYLNYGISEKRWANSAGYIPGSMSKVTNSTGTNSNSTYAQPIRLAGARWSNSKNAGCKHDVQHANIDKQPVYAIADGTIVCEQKVGASGKYNGKLVSYGNVIKFTSKDKKTKAIYAHLSGFSKCSAKVTASASYPCSSSQVGGIKTISLGTYSVKKGELIGYVGTTGNSTGPHLHFELYINGVRKEPSSYVKIN